MSSASDAGGGTLPFLLLPLALQHDIRNRISAFDLGTLNLACKATHTWVSANVTTLDVSVNRNLRPPQPSSNGLKHITRGLRNLRTELFPWIPTQQRTPQLLSSPQPDITPHASTPATHLPAVQHLTLRLHTFCCDFLSWFTTRYLPTLHHLTTLNLQLNTIFTTRDWKAIHHLLQQCSNLRSLEIGIRIGMGNVRLVLKDEPDITCATTHADVVKRLPQLLPSLLDESVLYPNPQARNENFPFLESLLASDAGCQLLHVLDTTKSHFSISQMDTNGRFSQMDIPAPPWLTGLRELRLPGHGCPRFDELAHLTCLKVGDTSYSPYSSHIGSITTLVHLEYCHDGYSEPPTYSAPLPDSWSQLQSLRTLELSGSCLLTPSSPLWKLTTLQHLNLLQHHVSSELTPLPSISALAALTSVCLSTSGGLPWFTACPWFKACLNALPTSLVELTLIWGWDPGMAAHMMAPDAWSLSRLCHLSALTLRLADHTMQGAWALPAISDLTSLQRLVLEGGGFEHIELADWLGELEHLTHLTLSGDIPPGTSPLWRKLDEVGRLKELCCGTAEQWSITHWPDVIPTSLTSLQVRAGREAQALPDQLSRCIQLQALHVDATAECQLSGVDVLVHLTALRQLRLACVRPMTCVSCIDVLTRLTSVVISGWGLQGEWPRLKAQGRLKEVLLKGFLSPPLEEIKFTDFSMEW